MKRLCSRMLPALCAGWLAASPAAAQCHDRGRALLEVAEHIVAADRLLSSLWPPFWPDGQAFLLAAPGAAVLLATTRAAPGSFVSLAPNMKTVRYYLHCGDLGELSASRGLMDIDHVIGRDTATAVPLRDTPAETIAFLVHEAFHGYQSRHFPAPRRNEAEVPAAAFSDPEYAAAAEAERRLLADAVRLPAGDRLHVLLRAFLSSRHERLRRLPEPVQVWERELETIEGTAEYVGRAAARMATDGTLAALPQELAGMLTSPLPDIAGFGNAEQWRHRARLYGTGAALVSILERLERDWRRSVEGGATLEEALCAALRQH